MQTFAKHMRLQVRKDAAKEFERVVFAEVLIPETPNVMGDYWTREAIKECAYEYARCGYIIDVDHDNVDVTGDVYVVETFIARDNDDTFIPGSWVVGMKIESDAIWQDILDGKINGYSFEALVSFLAAKFTVLDDGVRTGVTEPDPMDGHTHVFMVIVGPDNRPISGGTDETNGHSHTITYHTVTDAAEGHTHRYNLVKGKDGQ